MLPFSVVVDEAWNGKCLRYEVCLYPLPMSTGCTQRPVLSSTCSMCVSDLMSCCQVKCMCVRVCVCVINIKVQITLIKLEY